MIRVKSIDEFTLEDFDKLKNIKRARYDGKGKIFKDDTFECNKEMCDYLLGNNKLNKPVVKVIEVIPEKEELKEEIIEEPKKEYTPKKKKHSKK